MNSKIKKLTESELTNISGGGYYKRIFVRNGQYMVSIYWRNEGER